MSARYSRRPAGFDTPAPLTVTHPHAAGIDIHLGIHWVAVPPQSAPPPPPGHPATLPPPPPAPQPTCPPGSAPSALAPPIWRCWPTGSRNAASPPWPWSPPAST